MKGDRPMTRTRLTLGYSPCPHDTFSFYGLAHGRIATPIDFDIVMADIERLNQDARDGRLDVTKLSFAAIGHLLPTYGLLRSGAALGRGCGPLIVSRKGMDIDDLTSGPIAVPGMLTTASLLLHLYLGGPADVVPMRFDQIMPAVAEGRYPAGVIIHEGRFTFEDYGLIRLLDLGGWWDLETGLPIPLGGIAIRRDLGEETARLAETAIRESVLYALANPREPDAYIKAHSQELSDDVVRRHIALYVNDCTRHIGSAGECAIAVLLNMGRKAGVLPPFDGPLFACREQ